ncbi:MAG: glycosyltransferase [Verrucomicrobia bacterium]|nr:glycosyltransferase [Verrucomicrobiota bacterium]
MPQRVLHFITELNVGGAERLLAEVLPRLDRAKVEVQAAYLQGDGPLAAELESRGVRTHALRSPHKFSLWPAWRLARLLEREQIEILHTHLIQADILGFAAARLATTPLVVSTKHNVRYYEGRQRWLRPLARQVEERLDAVVAVSKAVAAEYGHARRVEVIHNGVDVAKFAPSPLPASGPIVCLGKLTMQKGHRILLEAVARLAEELPNLRVEIAGTGPLLDDLQARVARLKLPPNVDFLGVVGDVRPLLARAAMVVMPSLWEGFGLAALEAMACGRPVIASDVDGLREIITHERDGLLAPAGDVTKLAEAIARLLRDRTLAERLAAAGRARVVEAFTLDTMARKLEALYASLAGAS